ncbi:alpha/beta hydrolase [candidate division WOR-3 bacterium]|nr:alpha/beta hydrolase [candidate division WOR-3 bacterium]
MNRSSERRAASGEWRAASILALLVLLPGCMTLDSFLFEPTRVDEYFLPADMDTSWHVRGIIPDTLREAVTLKGLDDNKVYGFFVRALPDTDGPAQVPPTVLYCHGRGENINRYWGRVELLWEAGCNVFIFDYEGYGKSEGTPSGPALYADGKAALAHVLGRSDVDTTKIVHYGWSLGGFVASHLSADIRKPFATILENPIASTSALAKEGAVLAIPGSFVCDADFDNERRMSQLGPKVLLLYGDSDETAVPRRHAEVLIAARGTLPLQTKKVTGADHSDVPEVMGYDEYRGLVSDFIGN